jgi:glutaminase
MLRNFDILTEPPEPVVDLYFKQCSVSVNCRNLAVMAATLANHGTNPITGRQAIRGEYVESVLSVMGSCGMYDYAGEWLYRVGMPAKSGVSGGVIAVLPVSWARSFSPLLDGHFNSIRGLQVCNDLSRHFDLHLFNTPHASKSVVRLKFTAAEVNSNRVRTPEEAETLRARGHSIQIIQLQGNLALSTAEVVVHDVSLAEVWWCSSTSSIAFHQRKRHPVVLSTQAEASGAGLLGFHPPAGTTQLRR